MKANSEEGIQRLFDNLDDPRNSEIEIDEPIKCDNRNEIASGEYEVVEIATGYKTVERLCEACRIEMIEQGFSIEEMEGF